MRIPPDGVGRNRESPGHRAVVEGVNNFPHHAHVIFIFVEGERASKRASVGCNRAAVLLPLEMLLAETSVPRTPRHPCLPPSDTQSLHLWPLSSALSSRASARTASGRVPAVEGSPAHYLQCASAQVLLSMHTTCQHICADRTLYVRTYIHTYIHAHI